MNYKRDWDGKEWEVYSLRLVQQRHGPENVQIVPDKVKGDAGIEFFTTDGCCYQSYAPEEIADVAKAASAMKQKATRDLPKLIKNSDVISGLLGSLKIKRWILLCPFLEDKSVISHLRNKEADINNAVLEFLDPDFRTLVQSQDDFEKEIEILRQSSSGIPLKTSRATDDEVASFDNALKQRISEKLLRAEPGAGPKRIEKRTQAFITSLITGSNALQTLRQEYPDLWERARLNIEAEELRLETIGAGSGAPNEQLHKGLERLEDTMSSQLPTEMPLD